MTNNQSNHIDMVIIGAGLSGIGMACHFSKKCPSKTYTILEARDSIGGTWDLFRYPGIRSDSDMHTLGYKFKPWAEGKSIADGPSILRYIKEAAHEHQVDQHILFNRKVIAADWSSEKARWTLTVLNKSTGKNEALTCNFLSSCAGYYSYDQGYQPNFPGQESFAGPIIHPQKWPENLDYSGKKIVVIGSGATAVTLLPSLSDKAAHVTMLQRSPSYIVPMPAKDRIANFLRSFLPEDIAYKLVRTKNVTWQQFVYKRTRRHPEKTKQDIKKSILKYMGKDFDLTPHLTPTYNPWDERVCLSPDGDIFEAMKSGKASIVTDHIETLTDNGILLKSGDHLQADIIVSATGLNLTVMGGLTLSVDSQPVSAPDSFGYKGMMFSGIPNFVSVFGYTNASWTLRADLISEFVCRVMNHMDTTQTKQAMPVPPSGMTPQDWMEFQPGYIKRSLHMLPKQGDRDPWLNDQNYTKDRAQLTEAPLDDGFLQFSNPGNVNASPISLTSSVAAE